MFVEHTERLHSIEKDGGLFIAVETLNTHPSPMKASRFASSPMERGVGERKSQIFYQC